jgi:YfiH family protein
MQDVKDGQVENVVLMQQVHGDTLRVVGKKDLGKVILNCDGIYTQEQSLVLGVKVADCLPVIIKEKDAGIIAAVHAGWRGLNKNILKKAIIIIKNEFKIKPENLKVYIGPHICVKHYEVGPEMASSFAEYKNAFLRVGNKIFMDLESVALKQLLNCGVKVENISNDGRCTFEDNSLPSFRRDKTNKRFILLSDII